MSDDEREVAPVGDAKGMTPHEQAALSNLAHRMREQALWRRPMHAEMLAFAAELEWLIEPHGGHAAGERAEQPENREDYQQHEDHRLNGLRQPERAGELLDTPEHEAEDNKGNYILDSLVYLR